MRAGKVETWRHRLISGRNRIAKDKWKSNLQTEANLFNNLKAT